MIGIAEKTRFWNRKILDWESRRYEGGSNSVQARLRLARDLLASRVKNARVLDLGCGSGRFLSLLQTFQPQRLMGIDFSEAAISQAKNLYRNAPYEFYCGNAVEMDFPDFDYVTGLGLLDWLSLMEVDSLFRKLGGRPFLFSISERRWSLSRLLHFVFVFVTYAWKTKGYRPLYFSTAEIAEIARRNGYSRVYVFRHPSLSFGTFLSSFPLTEAYFDKTATTYEAKSAGIPWRWIRRREARAVESLLPDLAGKSVLEVASGSGYYTRIILSRSAARVTAVDLSARMLEQISSPPVEIRRGDFCELEFEGLFDFVLCAGGLEFMDSPDRFFAKALAVTRQNARLVLLVPLQGALGEIYRRYHRRHGLDVHLFPKDFRAPGWRTEKVVPVSPFAMAVRLAR